MKKIAILMTFNSEKSLKKGFNFLEILDHMDYILAIDGTTTEPSYPNFYPKVNDEDKSFSYHSVDKTISFLKRKEFEYNKLNVIDLNYPWTNKEEMLNYCIELLRKEFDDNEEHLLWVIDGNDLPNKEKINECEEKLLVDNYFSNKMNYNDNYGVFRWKCEFFLSHYPLELKKEISVYEM